MTPQNEPKPISPLQASLARRSIQLALSLFVVGLVLTVLAEWGERRAAAAAAWQDPGDTLQPEAVATDLALLSLAGVPDREVLTLAIELGELETTHALLAFSPDLTDQERTNGWLWLAQRYRQAGRTASAAQSYRLAGNGALLGIGLTDLLRVQTLLAVGQALRDLHDTANARLFLTQAAAIASVAPDLSPYHRYAVLEQVVPPLIDVGGTRDDWKELVERATSNRSAPGAVSSVQPGPPPAVSAAEHIAATPSASDFVRARDARRAAAAQWREQLGTADQTDLRDALADALRAEEAAVVAYVADNGSSGDGALAAQETLIRWLSLQRRVAAGGVGNGLVPEWETALERIEGELNGAWARWLTLQAEPTDTASFAAAPFGVVTPDGPPPGAARAAIMASFWGLFPDAPVEDLVGASVNRSDWPGLRLAVIGPGTPPILGWKR